MRLDLPRDLTPRTLCLAPAEGRARPRKYYAITPDGRTHLALLRTEWSGLVNAMQQLLDTLDRVRG